MEPKGPLRTPKAMKGPPRTPTLAARKQKQSHEPAQAPAQTTALRAQAQ